MLKWDKYGSIFLNYSLKFIGVFLYKSEDLVKLMGLLTGLEMKESFSFGPLSHRNLCLYYLSFLIFFWIYLVCKVGSVLFIGFWGSSFIYAKFDHFFVDQTVWFTLFPLWKQFIFKELHLAFKVSLFFFSSFCIHLFTCIISVHVSLAYMYHSCTCIICVQVLFVYLY